MPRYDNSLSSFDKALGLSFTASDHGRLMHDADPAFLYLVQRATCFGRQFPWVIELRHKVDPSIRQTMGFEHLQKFRIIQDAKGIKGKHFGAYTNDPYMIDCAQLFHDFSEFARRKEAADPLLSPVHC